MAKIRRIFSFLSNTPFCFYIFSLVMMKYRSMNVVGYILSNHATKNSYCFFKAGQMVSISISYAEICHNMRTREDISIILHRKEEKTWQKILLLSQR